MTNMLEQVLDHIHNYFYTGKAYTGTFTIENARITLDGMQKGQYFHITGSVFNDGIHKYGEVGLTDETFTGTIYPMAVPKTMLDIVDEIEAWVDKFGDVMNSPYQSERVEGVYEYQRATTNRQNGESVSDWQMIFQKRLNAWRKVGGR